MPSFTLNGYSITDGGTPDDWGYAPPTYETASLTFEFATDVDTISYDYTSSDPTIGFSTAAPERVLLNGTEIDLDFSGQFDEINLSGEYWTAAASSVVIAFFTADISFAAVLDGVGFPDLAVGGDDLGHELFDVISGGHLSEIAPRGPGRPIPLAEFFAQDIDMVPETGSARGERMSGGAGIDFLAALGGRDRLYGKGGDDVLLAGIGNDTAWGGAGDDVLSGFVGDDALFGGAGNDRLIGGCCRNVLTGGAGADTFVFQPNTSGGADRISDFGRGDRIEIQGIYHTARQIVNRFAEVTDDGVLITFPAARFSPSDPDTLLLEGLESLSGLWRRIDVDDFA